MHRPSHLMQFLQELKTGPKKRLSQNFLIDLNIIKKILLTAHVEEGDSILEIGAGPGALTEALYLAKAKIVAIEKDPLFAEALKRLEGVAVFEGDVRHFPFDGLPKGGKVVANLPYHLTSTILELLLPRYDLFKEVTVMVQHEVAKRITAQPKTKDYSPLTLFVNFYSEAHYAFFVSRNSFYPSPKVDSAVVFFQLKKPPLENPAPFFDFIRTLFCHRRKMIRSLFTSKEKVDLSLNGMGFPKEARPSDLALEQLITLFKETL